MDELHNDIEKLEQYFETLQLIKPVEEPSWS